MALRFAPALALSAVACLAFTDGAAACTCAPVGKTLRGYDAAVTARLVNVERSGPQSGRATFSYKISRIFKGGRRYKLDEGEALEIRSSLGGSSCGLPRRRQRYGLLLFEYRGELAANLCTVVTPRRLRRMARRGDGGRERVTPVCGVGEIAR